MLDAIIEERKKKLAKWKNAGYSPYPSTVKRTHAIKDVLDSFDDWASRRETVSIVGRVFALRDQGKLIFIDIRDETGKIQGILKNDGLSNFSLLQEALDVGDFVELGGALMLTDRGEKSIAAQSSRIIVKSLRPLPDKYYGLEEVETRLRKRYLDILINEEVRELFRKKTLFWQTCRDFLVRGGFFEVETPVLEATPGGADAEPFTTHHNALDTDFFLRISLEIPLKKLLVAGYEKVFEIGRVFRNEGIDREHLQEYTQMECYAAYWDHERMMNFVEALYKDVIKKTMNDLCVQHGDKIIDWEKKWPRLDYFELFLKANNIDLRMATDDDLRQKAMELKLEVPAYLGRGRLIDLIYKKTVRPTLMEPSFLVNHPIEVSPLAKKDPADHHLVLRFQPVALGTELGNGWAELNDPIDQRTRFKEQMRLREAGDTEAQRSDEEFLEAMEYGMPPAAGFGLSERLFSIIVDRPMRETVIFPPMRRSNR